MTQLYYVVTLEALIIVISIAYTTLTLLESLVRGDKGVQWYVPNPAIYMVWIVPVLMLSSIFYVVMFINRPEPMTSYSWLLTIVCGFLLVVVGFSDYKALKL